MELFAPSGLLSTETEILTSCGHQTAQENSFWHMKQVMLLQGTRRLAFVYACCSSPRPACVSAAS